MRDDHRGLQDRGSKPRHRIAGTLGPPRPALVVILIAIVKIVGVPIEKVCGASNYSNSSIQQRRSPGRKMNAGQRRLQSEFRDPPALCGSIETLAPPKGSAAMTRIALIALALAASTTAAGAYDYSRGGRIDAREAAQARRIEHNRRTGELTWYEAAKLRAEQRRIHAMEAWARRDGHISRCGSAPHRGCPGRRQPPHLPREPRRPNRMVAPPVVGVADYLAPGALKGFEPQIRPGLRRASRRRGRTAPRSCCRRDRG